MKYHLWTIGCQMNAADSRRVADELERLGLDATAEPESADLVVLNTCVVRQSAETKVVGRITSLQGIKRRRPNVRLVVMGCFVNEIPALQHRYPYVDAFIRPSDVQAVVALAREQLAAGPAVPRGMEAWEIVSGLPAGGPQHANAQVASVEQAGSEPAIVQPAVGVPINYGCDHLCTYCIVRLRRGPEVSRPVPDIVAEVAGLVARGAREVTLLGQNVDSYGHDLPPLTPGGDDRWPPDLADLLAAVHDVEGLSRIRFLTSHPADMSDRLIEAAARLPKVCEHMEIPVQSGDDAVLRRMGRGYTVAQYRDLVARIRATMPDAGLATDVIVGFPGETQVQFEATYRLLEELRFDVVHVAAYSLRPGTPAERLTDDVPPNDKEHRRQAVDRLQERVTGEINARLLGQVVEVLVEARHRGKWQGRTRTNKLVFFPTAGREWTGRLVPVRITWTGPWSMQGEVEP